MAEPVAGLLVGATLAYLALGLLFAVPFVARWAGRLDPAARVGTIGFRLLAIPGAAFLWPLLAVKLVKAR